MATVKVDPKIMEELLFGYSPNPVAVECIGIDQNGMLNIEVSGHDVPRARDVRALYHVQQNRVGHRLVTLTFEPIETG